MAYLFTSKQFIDKLVDIAEKGDNIYAYGMWGWPLTKSNILQKQQQYPWFYTNNKVALLNNNLDKFGFDCVNLIKGILWGWNGDKNAKYGGAGYGINGVPDTNADGMMNTYCVERSEDFSIIIPGEAVWISGHIGVYIGDGKVVECTIDWANKVQITALHNKGTIQGLNGRKWTKHGKLPWIDYTNTAEPDESNNDDSSIVPGDTVTILPNAVYGGAHKGKLVPAQYIGKRYTVSQVKNNEALIKELFSWVALSYLQK